MKRKRRIAGILIVAMLVGLSTVTGVAAEKPKASKDVAYLRPDYTIETEDSALIFKDINSKRVYPLVYKDSTYLPVRTISALMDEDIEWDSYSRTVYIGKTLSNPNKSIAKKDLENKKCLETVDKENYQIPTDFGGVVAVHVRPEVLIMYDFEIQNLEDDQGNTVYPIIYEGGTYLPLRAISNLMEQDLIWDDATKTITIKDNSDEEGIAPGFNHDKLTEVEKQLIEEFDSAVELYDQATDKLLTLQKSSDPEMKVLLSKSISEDYLKAQEQARRVRTMDATDFNEIEKVVYETVHQFLEISEYYILVIENIAYMATEGKDYSMLAETFFIFAMDTQDKMDIARSAVDEIRP